MPLDSLPAVPETPAPPRRPFALPAAVRALVASVLLAAAPAADIRTADAAAPYVEKEDETDALLRTLPKADLQRLLLLLDDDRFRVREGAQAQLIARAAGQYEESSTLPSWTRGLTPAAGGAQWEMRDAGKLLLKDPSLEVRHRLVRVQRGIEDAKGEILIRPTECVFPRKRMALRDALAVMSAAMGRRVTVWDREGKAGDEMVDVESGPFWKAASGIVLKDGKRLWPMSCGPQGVEFRIADPGTHRFAAAGGVLARFNTADNLCALYLEPKAAEQSWAVLAVQMEDKGVKRDLLRFGDAEVRGSPTAELPVPKGATGTLRAEIRVTMAPVRRHAVKDIAKNQEIATSGHAFTFTGVSAKPDGEGNYAVTLRLPDKTHYAAHYKIRCLAEAKGKPLATAGQGGSAEEIRFWFPGARPDKVAFCIPDELETEMQATAHRTLVWELGG